MIDPQWILDSVERNKLQSFTQYTILRDSSSSIDRFIHRSKSDQMEGVKVWFDFQPFSFLKHFFLTNYHFVFNKTFPWVCSRVSETFSIERVEFTADSDSDDGYKLPEEEVIEKNEESSQEEPADFPELQDEDEVEDEEKEPVADEVKESGQTKRVRSPGR